MTGSTTLNQRRNSEFVGPSKNLANSQRLMDIEEPKNQVSRQSNNYLNNMHSSQKFNKP